MNKVECIRRLKQILPSLEKDYLIIYLGLFGSFSSNSYHDNSDIDILVSFSRPPSLFRLIEIEKKIKQHLGKRVDIVIKKAIDADFYNRISNELIEIVE